MGPEVFVVGALHRDVIVDAPRLPRLDETLVGTGVAYRLGGKGGNQALAAARLGARVAMAGQVGTDAAGQEMRATLAAGGINTTQIRVIDGASGMSVAIVDAAGRYGAVIVSGANRTIDPKEIALPETTRLLLLQNEIPEPVNQTLADAAKAAGATVILNAAPARPVAPALLAATDILVVNRVEAADLVGDQPVAAQAAALQALGPATVILTLGEDGAVFATDGALEHLPAHPVEVVSTHGAGDAYIGAFAAAHVRGATPLEAAAFAGAAAALHVSVPVADRAAITAGAIRAFQSSSR